ncbi:hypothetical protein BpHYR1_017959 [Brachionus plicatilis]|uniref:RNA-directed DNA polymerase from mobile element jockey-like n=1 Tax=Brachionus plicatilis TaxID=10195 RepID=A0A3M7R7C7_BRAPC|nr:hypothetical protein BpHYR1_017959 [Brachionus plicatilis]
MDVSISSFFMSSPLGLMSGDECSGVRDGDFPTFGNDFHCLGKELFFSCESNVKSILIKFSLESVLGDDKKEKELSFEEFKEPSYYLLTYFKKVLLPAGNYIASISTKSPQTKKCQPQIKNFSDKNCSPQNNDDSLNDGGPILITKQLTKTKQRENFLTNRVVNSWNSLPSEIINASSKNNFKNKLDSYLKQNAKHYLHKLHYYYTTATIARLCLALLRSYPASNSSPKKKISKNCMSLFCTPSIFLNLITHDQKCVSKVVCSSGFECVLFLRKF